MTARSSRRSGQCHRYLVAAVLAALAPSGVTAWEWPVDLPGASVTPAPNRWPAVTLDPPRGGVVRSPVSGTVVHSGVPAGVLAIADASGMWVELHAPAGVSVPQRGDVLFAGEPLWEDESPFSFRVIDPRLRVAVNPMIVLPVASVGAIPLPSVVVEAADGQRFAFPWRSGTVPRLTGEVVRLRVDYSSLPLRPRRIVVSINESPVIERAWLYHSLTAPPAPDLLAGEIVLTPGTHLIAVRVADASGVPTLFRREFRVIAPERTDP